VTHHEKQGSLSDHPAPNSKSSWLRSTCSRSQTVASVPWSPRPTFTGFWSTSDFHRRASSRLTEGSESERATQQLVRP